MARSYPLWNLYCICCGVFLAAIAFMRWIDYRGTILTGLETPGGGPVLAIGAAVVGMGLHPGFDQRKAALVAVAGLAAAGVTLSFGEGTTWTGTTYWVPVVILLGVVVAVIGLAGMFFGEDVDYTLVDVEGE